MKMRNRVTVREVGPREALQASPSVVPTEGKVKLIRDLISAGYTTINAVSFVHPGVMPQMADAEKVLETLGPVDDVVISALTPNLRALERAVPLADAGLLKEVHFIHAASEAVLLANGIRQTLDEHLGTVLSMCREAKAQGLRTVVFISAAFGCSVNGRVAPEVPLGLVRVLQGSGCVDEIAISDSTGQADPLQVASLYEDLAEIVGAFPVTAHFHDSRGAALANILAVLLSPVENLTVDVAFAGLGGDVPFLAEAAGNASSDDLVVMLSGMGVESGVDIESVLQTTRDFCGTYGLPIMSRTPAVGPVSWKA